MTDAAPARGPDEPEELDRLARLIAHSPHNLVARGDRPSIRRRHIAECAALAPVLAATGGTSWVDLGTGGGLPGLVLAILQPGVRWTLVDSTRKKIAAVQDFAGTLGLENVRAVAGRAETLARDAAYRERFDGVVSRAVADLPVLLELCRGFVGTGGTIVALKGPRWQEELAASATAMRELRLRFVHSTELTSPDRTTWAVTMTALGPTPAAYPRRVGRPRSLPLGGHRP